MGNNEIKLKRITYGELKNREFSLEGDDFGMVSEYFNDTTRDALLSNPNLTDDSKTVLNIAYYSGQIVGRHMMMPTRLKLGEQVLYVQSGGGHEVVESCRGKGIGTRLVQDSIFNGEFSFYIGQLYSTQAISILRKLGVTVFEVPQYYKLCNFRCILEAKGLRGLSLLIGAAFGNMVLRICDIPYVLKLWKLNRRYMVKKEFMIPEWVDNIVLGDRHPFTEYHDHTWFQWNVDYKFPSKINDKQEFYAVYDRRNNPCGFFMTKVRFESEQGIYKNIRRGTIVEWGSTDENVLTEIDLNVLAVQTLKEQVDNITTVISNQPSKADMKRYGFLRHGAFQMVIKPDEFNKQNVMKQEYWRIRYGGCNTIVF